MTPDEPTTPDLADIGRRLVEAFNARDIEGYIAYCDPSGGATPPTRQRRWRECVPRHALALACEAEPGALA